MVFLFVVGFFGGEFLGVEDGRGMVRVGVVRGRVVALGIGGSGGGGDGLIVCGLSVALIKSLLERSTACVAHETVTIPCGFTHFTPFSSSNVCSWNILV